MRQIESFNSVKVFYFNREEVIQKLKEILRSLKQNYISIKKVYLFGSMARNEHTGLSDIDLLIVSEEELDHQTKKEFYFELLDHLTISVDVFFLTKKEMKNYKNFIKKIIFLA